MKKNHLLIILCCTLLCHPGYSQNLLPNPGFESSSYCPTGYNNTFRGGYNSTPFCTSWYDATGGTPDYFNSCDSVGYPWAGIPANNLGYQPAYSGHAYVGIYTYVVNNGDYKEYMMAHIPALEPGAKYRAGMMVSLSNFSNFGTDGLAALFTTYGSPDTATFDGINKIPQVNYSAYGVIKDTLHWVALMDTFIADSAYTTIIIGDFKNRSIIKVDTTDTAGMNPGSFTYYYIDSISLEKIGFPSGIQYVNNLQPAVHLFPNPFTDQATLTFNNYSNDPHTLLIYNAIRQQVQKVEGITTGQVSIQRNGLPPGYYYFRLTNDEHIVANGKFEIK